MADMEKLVALNAAIREAEENLEYDKSDKLRSERKRLLDADKIAEREAQKEARSGYVEAFEAAVTAISIPKGTKLSVQIKRTETGFDEMTVALSVIEPLVLMEHVHAAIEAIDVPSTVDGIKFVDGAAELTGRSARATGTGNGNGGGGGAGHFWQKAGQEAVKLDTAFLDAGGSKDDMVAVKDGDDIPFSEATGSQTWAHKQKLVKAAGYEAVTIEA